MNSDLPLLLTNLTSNAVEGLLLDMNLDHPAKHVRKSPTLLVQCLPTSHKNLIYGVKGLGHHLLVSQGSS